MIIAIDGPAASGKGTLARRLASHYGFPYLETGLLYRAVARRVLDAGEDPQDHRSAFAAAHALISQDLLSTRLRAPEVDHAASLVAAIPEVRQALLEYQRNFAAHGGVLDGRDIGTRIFPDANVKFFVVASLEARASRRLQQLQDAGIAIDLATVRHDIERRDAIDAQRLASPLRIANDAVRLDTTDLTPDEAFSAAVRTIDQKMGFIGNATVTDRTC